MVENDVSSRDLRLKIGKNGNEDLVWIKRLKNIIESDIHRSPLGCKIDGTHIKIGSTHLESFFEAQILFSHHFWVNQFAGWMVSQIKHLLDEVERDEIVVMGYETYLESVMFAMQKMAAERGIKLHYFIFEEPRFTQNIGYLKTEKNIRYLDSFLQGKKNCDDYPVVFLCGVSSSLSTFALLKNEYSKHVMDKLNADYKYWMFSLIQVIPKNDQGIDIIYKDDIFCLKQEKDDTIVRVEKDSYIKAKYLVGVKCNWHYAKECPLCFPTNFIDEKPIVGTSETSIIPAQMIEPMREKPISSNNPMNEEQFGRMIENSRPKIDFFVKCSGKYVFLEYLYFSHIDRMDHHYKYYFRNAHLIKDILDKSLYNSSFDSEEDKNELLEESKKIYDDFRKICDEIKYDLKKSERNNEIINIIVFPSNRGDEVFANAINTFVFDNKAYTLSLDPNKEFRSNFETKFSNIAYYIDQIGQLDTDIKYELRFHYVTKQLISNVDFSRVKSLLRSLMEKRKGKNNEKRKGKNNEVNVKIFSDVIVFLSRNSSSTKMNYVEKIENYYSFIDISVPSLRFYGDACPLCKKNQDALLYTKASALDINARHWANKQNRYKAVSIEEAKRMYSKDDSMQCAKKDRYFVRLEAENNLWKTFYGCQSEDDYAKAICEAMAKSSVLKKEKSREREYSISTDQLISYIKAVSSPFLYYKENEKKAALAFVLNLMEQYLKSPNKKIEKILLFETKNDKKNTYYVRFEAEEEYQLLVALINCLAEMNSTFILSSHRIRSLLSYVANEWPLLLQCKGNKKATEYTGCVDFFSCIVHACKRVVCGISGKYRASYFEKQLILEITNNDEEIQEFVKKINDFDESKCARDPDIIEKYCYYKLLLELLIDNFSNPDIPKKLPNESVKSTNIWDKYSNILPNFLLCNDDNRFGSKCMIENISFVYFEKMSNDNKAFYIGNHSSDMLNETKSKIEKCYESADGIVFYNDTWYISTRFFSAPMEQMTSDCVVMIVSFDKDSSILNRILNLRKVLEYRYCISEIISADLEDKAILSAIQAKEAEKLISSGKSIVHGGIQEVSELCDLSVFLLKKWNTVNDDDKKEYFKMTCEEINAIMSRCISYSSTQDLLICYYSEKKTKDFSIKNFFIFPVQKQGDISFNACNPEVSWESCGSKSFLIEYLKQLNEIEDSEYWKETILQKCKTNKLENVFQVLFYVESEPATCEKATDYLINAIEKTNGLPCFLNANTFMADSGCILLVGIIDTLIRNVLSHGDSGEIKISFVHEENGYRIIVRNKYSKLESDGEENGGLTKRFFDKINALNEEEQEHFSVWLYPNPEDNSEFVSELYVRKGGKLL